MTGGARPIFFGMRLGNGGSGRVGIDFGRRRERRLRQTKQVTECGSHLFLFGFLPGLFQFAGELAGHAIHDANRQDFQSVAVGGIDI